MTARPPVTGYRCEFCDSTDRRIHFHHCPTIGDDTIWAEWLQKVRI